MISEYNEILLIHSEPGEPDLKKKDNEVPDLEKKDNEVKCVQIPNEIRKDPSIALQVLTLKEEHSLFLFNQAVFHDNKIFLNRVLKPS